MSLVKNKNYFFLYKQINCTICGVKYRIRKASQSNVCPRCKSKRKKEAKTGKEESFVEVHCESCGRKMMIFESAMPITKCTKCIEKGK